MSLLLLSDSEGLEAIGLVQGVSTATAVGVAYAIGAGASNGLATASGETPSAVGISNGTSTALGQNPTGDGSSNGLAVVQGWAPIATGTSTAFAVVVGQVPIATGSSTAFAIVQGQAPIGTGTSIAFSTVAGFANNSTGVAAGSSTASGQVPIATGTAAGSSTATGSSFSAVGTATGSSTAVAFAGYYTAVGFTQGTGDATAIGLRLFLATGSIAGLATAAAAGEFDTVSVGGFGGLLPHLGQGLNVAVLERGLLRVARKQPSNAKDLVSEICRTYEEFARTAQPTPILTGRRVMMENTLLPAISNPNNPRNQSVNALVQSFQSFWIGTPLVVGGTVTSFLGAPILAVNLNQLFLKNNTTESLARQIARCMMLATKQVQYVIPGVAPGFLA